MKKPLLMVEKKESLFTEEELDLLNEEGDLRDALKSGKALTDEENKTLAKIETLRKEIPSRLEKAGTPEKKPDTQNDEDKIVLQALAGYVRRQRKALEKLKKGEGDKGNPKPDDKGEDKPEKKTELTDLEWREQTEFILGADTKPTKSELRILRAIAKEEGKSLAEASETEEYKTFSEAHRKKKSSDEKTPLPSSRSEVLSGDLDPDKMSDEEHKKNFPAMVDKITQKLSGKTNI